MTAALTLVSESTEPLSDRIRRLQAEARSMARQLIAECEGRAQTLDAILMRTRD